MAVLITGASGFVGQALIPKLLDKEHKIYGLYRQKAQPGFTIDKFIPLSGDITKTDLGLEKVPEDIDAVIHSAALLSFSPRDKEKIYQTNYQGTINLLEWMEKNKISRLFHLSTAYLFKQNHYEISKQMAEVAINSHSQIKTTILRPSIIVGDSKVEGVPPLSGFYSGIKAIDHTKRWFEQKSGLPPLRTQIRIYGLPAARLNLIPIDVVVGNIVEIIAQDKVGIFQLTHPDPPTLESLECPISEAIGADIKFVPEFKPNLLERVIAMSLRELFPYLKGCDLTSDIECPPLDATFIEKSIKAFLKG